MRLFTDDINNNETCINKEQMDTLVENSSSFTEVTCTALEQMDEDEPELFLFNESFDANLFKLKRNNQHHHNLNSTYETSLANFDLINDLNKLYKNKFDVFLPK